MSRFNSGYRTFCAALIFCLTILSAPESRAQATPEGFHESLLNSGKKSVASLNQSVRMIEATMALLSADVSVQTSDSSNADMLFLSKDRVSSLGYAYSTTASAFSSLAQEINRIERNYRENPRLENSAQGQRFLALSKQVARAANEIQSHSSTLNARLSYHTAFLDLLDIQEFTQSLCHQLIAAFQYEFKGSDLKQKALLAAQFELVQKDLFALVNRGRIAEAHSQTANGVIPRPIKNSADLLAQIFAALAIKGALERDPLPVIQLVENLPGTAIAIAPTMFVFEKLAEPVTAGVTQLLATKKVFRPGLGFFEKTLSQGAGMLSGAVALKLISEALSGDLVKYFDEGAGAEVAGFLAGMGAGLATSETVSLLGAKGLALGGVANPAGATALGFVAGTAFFLTCDPVQHRTRDYFKNRANQKRLREVLAGSVPILKGISKNISDQVTQNGAYGLHMKYLMDSFEGIQESFLQNFFDLETEYLKESIEKKKKYFRKAKLIEFLLGGGTKATMPTSTNMLDWQSEELPLPISIGLSLAPAEKMKILEEYRNRLEKDISRELRKLEGQYETARHEKIKSALANPKLHQAIEFQYHLFAKLVIENFRALRNSPESGSIIDALKDLNGEPEMTFLELAQKMANLQSAFALTAGDLPQSVVDRADVSFAALNRVADIYRRVRRGTYLFGLSDRAQMIFEKAITNNGN